MAIRRRMSLGEILVSNGVITEKQLHEALELQKKEKERIGKLLIKLGYATEEQIITNLATQLSIPYVDLSKIWVEKFSDLINKEALDIIKKHTVVPISKKGNVLTLAMADPLDVIAIDAMKLATGLEIQPVVALEKHIKLFIKRHYEDSVSLKDIVEDAEHERAEAYMLAEKEEALVAGKIEVSEEEGEEAPIVKLINHILSDAIKTGASDVHIETYEDSLRIRTRIDGVLYETSWPPKALSRSLVSRVKIMADLNIAEKRRPQDGRCKIKINDKEVDLRVSVAPTTSGEKVVIRILDPKSLCVKMESLGFEERDLTIYLEKVKSPYGIILITGPTGSGKTTTLYSTLSILNSSDKNIMTIEDPVEYMIKGINQVQVKADIGLTFASGLRSFLRQDPDIILVGEIRDTETAEVAINAALTGHLVFSTLHTNDAAGAITRLLNMGIEPYLISSTVIMCVAQRLVRKICEHCKENYRPHISVLDQLDISLQQLSKAMIRRGRGCPECNNTGYRGRTGIYEVMVVSDKIRDLIMEKQPSERIKAQAIKEGMLTLREAALSKVLRGITTVDELMRVTFEQKAFEVVAAQEPLKKAKEAG
jgi:type IV pilus assembly protein PilB